MHVCVRLRACACDYVFVSVSIFVRAYTYVCVFAYLLHFVCLDAGYCATRSAHTCMHNHRFHVRACCVASVHAQARACARLCMCVRVVRVGVQRLLFVS